MLGYLVDLGISQRDAQKLSSHTPLQGPATHIGSSWKETAF